jgi:hypothetical protein
VEIPILKLMWNPPPNVPKGHAFIGPLFTIQIGTQSILEKHWSHIQAKLLMTMDESNPRGPGDRLVYYANGDVKIIKK